MWGLLIALAVAGIAAAAPYTVESQARCQYEQQVVVGATPCSIATPLAESTASFSVDAAAWQGPTIEVYAVGAFRDAGGEALNLSAETRVTLTLWYEATGLDRPGVIQAVRLSGRENDSNGASRVSITTPQDFRLGGPFSVVLTAWAVAGQNPGAASAYLTLAALHVYEADGVTPVPYGTMQSDVVAIPEPASWWLSVCGLFALTPRNKVVRAIECLRPLFRIVRSPRLQPG